MAKIIRQQHKEIEYLKRQREILSLVQSTMKDPAPHVQRRCKSKNSRS